MKSFFTVMLSLLFAASVFSQEAMKNKEYYSAKSKRQKTGAKVMLIGGAALVGAGFLIGDRKESSFDDAATGVILGGIGVGLMIGSIPVFIASGKNSRKAMSLSFKNEKIYQLQNTGLVYKPLPSLVLKISL